MSFAIPLRSFARHGASSMSRTGLGLQLGARRFAHQPTAIVATIRHTSSSQEAGKFPWAGPLALLAGLGLPALLSDRKPLSLESLSNSNIRTSAPFTSDTALPGEVDFPKSDVNVYNLGFGSICGICSGIFIKKGAKFIAFLLGGGFVILQYLNTSRSVSVNWKSLASGYDSVLSKAAGEDAISINRSSATGWTDSRAARIWNRSIDFLTADFPSRGTFVAGLLLGLRLG